MESIELDLHQWNLHGTKEKVVEDIHLGQSPTYFPNEFHQLLEALKTENIYHTQKVSMTQ